MGNRRYGVHLKVRNRECAAKVLGKLGDYGVSSNSGAYYPSTTLHLIGSPSAVGEVLCWAWEKQYASGPAAADALAEVLRHLTGRHA